MLTIALYTGEGAAPLGIRAFLRFFAKQGWTVLEIDHRFFVSDNWQRNTVDWIVMPGGRDLPYCKNLKGEPNRRIRTFVESGGAYLGICAGAYYGSGYVAFDEGGCLEVFGERELAFFPGRAVGPLYKNRQFSYSSDSGAGVAKIKMAGSTSFSYFNGGCTFEGAEQYENVEVWATYADFPGALPAIINCKVGKGHAILSGIHPEMPLLSLKGQHTREDLLLWQKEQEELLRSWFIPLAFEKSQFPKCERYAYAPCLDAD